MRKIILPKAALGIGILIVCSAARAQSAFDNPQTNQERQRRLMERDIQNQAEQRRQEERTRLEYERAVQDRRQSERQIEATREQTCVLRGGRWAYGSCIEGR